MVTRTPLNVKLYVNFLDFFNVKPDVTFSSNSLRMFKRVLQHCKECECQFITVLQTTIFEECCSLDVKK